MEYLNKDWMEILNLANQSIDQLRIPDIVRQLDFIMKINQKVCQSVGPGYVCYLKKIFNDMLHLYRLYSQCISDGVRNKNDPMLKPMKSLRRDILKLLQTYIQEMDDMTIFVNEFLPQIKGLVEDYQQSNPDARDPEVLMLFATMSKKLGPVLHDFLNQILYNLCETTLEMIKNDYINYPEFREGFFTLVGNIVKHCT